MLRQPKFFQGGGIRRQRSMMGRDRGALERKRVRSHRIGETKREWTSGEDLGLRIRGRAGVSCVGWKETQSRFVQPRVVMPKAGRTTLGHHRELIVPLTLAQRPEAAERFLKKIRESRGVVWATCDFHSMKAVGV
jgi:hypothetical protein